jgi:hypothetical protein
MGHIDSIMWASWSPVDSTIIATASWDATFRIWNAETGECRHVIYPSQKKGKNWAGCFSSNGEYILLSGTNNVGVYNVKTGHLLHKLEYPGLTNWAAREVAWSHHEIAIENGTSVLLWRPFTHVQEWRVEEVVEVLKVAVLPEEENIKKYLAIHRICWLARGRILAVRLCEGTWFLWDMLRNVMWRFQRPKAMKVEMYGTSCAYVEETGSFWSLDGDGKAREWSLR